MRLLRLALCTRSGLSFQLALLALGGKRLLCLRPAPAHALQRAFDLALHALWIGTPLRLRLCRGRAAEGQAPPVFEQIVPDLIVPRLRAEGDLADLIPPVRLALIHTDPERVLKEHRQFCLCFHSGSSFLRSLQRTDNQGGRLLTAEHTPPRPDYRPELCFYLCIYRENGSPSVTSLSYGRPRS